MGRLTMDLLPEVFWEEFEALLSKEVNRPGQTKVSTAHLLADQHFLIHCLLLLMGVGECTHCAIFLSFVHGQQSANLCSFVYCPLLGRYISLLSRKIIACCPIF